MNERVSGHELRLLADRADAAGQKQLAMSLHYLAAEQEAVEEERRSEQCRR